jgi:hypothetical protein
MTNTDVHRFASRLIIGNRVKIIHQNVLNALPYCLEMWPARMARNCKTVLCTFLLSSSCSTQRNLQTDITKWLDLAVLRHAERLLQSQLPWGYTASSFQLGISVNGRTEEVYSFPWFLCTYLTPTLPSHFLFFIINYPQDMDSERCVVVNSSYRGDFARNWFGFSINVWLDRNFVRFELMTLWVPRKGEISWLADLRKIVEQKCTGKPTSWR